MQGTGHQGLTTDELLRHIYACNYNVSVSAVKELYDRFVRLLDKTPAELTADAHQQKLPL